MRGENNRRSVLLLQKVVCEGSSASESRAAWFRRKQRYGATSVRVPAGQADARRGYRVTHTRHCSDEEEDQDETSTLHGGEVRVLAWSGARVPLQGYLAHKKTPPP